MRDASHKTAPTTAARRKAQAQAAARKKAEAKGKGLKEPARVAEQLRQYQMRGKVF
jgi:hypothetical protein